MASTVELLTPEDAAARSGMYRLLARLWLREVDRDLLQELTTAPLCDAFTGAGGLMSAREDADTIEELAIEYCRLFIGPTDHLPPFQSVWQSGQFQDGTAASMKEFVEIVGYDTDAVPSGIMLDHLGIELDVMGHILSLMSASPAEPQTEAVQNDLLTSYSLTHLQWPTELLEAAGRRVTSDFYRSVIGMTGAFLRSEAQAFCSD